MTIRKFAFVTASCVLAATARAQATKPSPHEYFCDKDGVAIKGYDVVAYHGEAGTATPGSPEFTTTYGGCTWRFATAANLAAFKAAPEKYLPQYGGYCAYGMAKGGYMAPTDPTVFAVVNGKLYLNYNAQVGETWNKDRADYIKVADEKWAKLTK